MDSFSSYLFRKAYKKIHKLGDRLARIEPLIDWEAFRPIIQGLYDNKTPRGGRPNVDPVVMAKLLARSCTWVLFTARAARGVSSPPIFAGLEEEVDTTCRPVYNAIHIPRAILHLKFWWTTDQ